MTRRTSRSPAPAAPSRPRLARLVHDRGVRTYALANLLAAGALVEVLGARVPTALLAGWAAVLAAAIGLLVHASQQRDPRSRSLDGTVAASGVALAAAWAMPGLVMAHWATPAGALAICLATAAAMTAAAGMVPRAPRAMLGPIAAGGLAQAAMLLGHGAPWIAVLPIILGAVLVRDGLAAAADRRARVRAEAALVEKEEVVSLLLREFEDAGADWLWQVDAAKRLQSISARLAYASGREIHMLEQLPLLDLISEPGRSPSPEAGALIERMNARESFSDLDVQVVVEGEPRWWRLSAAPRHDDRGAFIGFRGVGSDVTEQRRSAARIETMARYDALTGLANRGEVMDALRKRLAAAFRDGGCCALLLVDLDKFKPVNDTLGHPIGDRLLKLVAERVRGRLSEHDMAGRLGGDEFAVVLGEVRDPARIADVADAIIAALGEPFEIDGNVIRIGASIGSAIGPRDGRSVELLVRNADLALYRAKDDGRGLHRRYDVSLLVLAEKRRALETALREAIDDGRQFSLVYQPTVDAETGAIERFEALIRWIHPVLGEVPPGDFLPVASESRLLGHIGEWALRTACAEAAKWPTHLGLSVNVSADQLHDRQFASIVLGALGNAGLAPERLELEVSEGVFLRDNQAVIAVLDGLQAIGVRIALDDFGCGLASFGYLRHGRFSAIKIDDAFVRGAAGSSPESRAIVRAGVALASSLGIDAVAEGCETPADLSRVRELGCRRIQGHLAGVAMSADEVRGFVKRADGGRRKRKVA